MRPLLISSLILLIASTGSAQKAPERAPARAGLTHAAIKPMPAHAATAPAGFDTLVKPFLAENCYSCHGKEKQKKEINFEAMESVAALADDPDVWEEVVRRLRGREMPPEEEPQPAEQARQAVAGWIDRELKRIDRTTPPDPGRVTTRRLNRTEYNNTIAELLGVTMRPADDFPQDDSGYGFDNIADVLSLSPGLMEKYISAADKVARTALFGPPALKPTLLRLRSEGRRVKEAKTFPGDYDVTGLSLPNAFHAIHRVPVDGEYLVKVTLGGLRPKGSAADHDRALGGRAGGDDADARSGGGRVVQRRPPRFRRAGGRVPREACRRRPLALGGHSACLRRAPAEVRRPESLDASDCAESVHATGRRSARTDCDLPQAVRRRPGGARQDPDERRPRQRGRHRRARTRT